MPEVLAHCGQAVRPTPRPLPDEAAQALAALVERRRQVVALRTAAENRLGATRVATVRARIQAHLAWLAADLGASDQDLRQALKGLSPTGERRWTARAVAVWMSSKLSRPVRVRRGWDYLQRLKQSQQVPRPQHALADPHEQAAFKKTSVPC